jgi:hypothetical protein
MGSWSFSARVVWAAVSVQVAAPVVLVSGVHSCVFPVLNATGWPLTGVPEAVSFAVRTRTFCVVRKLAVRAVGAWATVWVRVPAEAA